MLDSLAFPLFLTVNGLLFAACRRLVVRDEEASDSLQRWLDTAVLFFGVIVLIVELLGTFGWLRRWAAITAAAALWLGSRWLTPERDGAGRAAVGPGLEARQLSWRSLPMLTGIFFVVLAMLSVFYRNRANGPEGWDVFTYHLGFPAEWLTSGTLHNSLQHYGDFSPPFYPLNSSFLAAWTMLLTNSDVIARYTQWFFLLAALPALFRLARLLGLSAAYAIIAPVSFALLPMTLDHMRLAYCDLSLAGAFVLALEQIIAYAWQPGRYRSIMAGVAMGLFMGIKYSSAPFSAPLWIAAGVVLLSGANKVKNSLSFLGMSMVTGGYTYMRNFLLAGNPLFPAQVKIAGWRLFAGWVDPTYLQQLDFHRIALRTLFLSADGLGDVGFQTTFLLLPAALLAPLVGLAARNKLREAVVSWRLRWFILCFPLVLFGLYYFVLPYRYEARFFFPALAAAALTFAFTGAALALPAAGVMTLLLGFAAANTYSMAPVLWLLPLALSLGCAVIAAVRFLPALPRFQLWRRGGVRIVVVCAVLAGSCSAGGAYLRNYRKAQWHHIPGAYGDMIRWLEKTTRHSSLRIAYAGFNAPYPLHGVYFQHEVSYIPHSPPPKGFYGFFEPSPPRTLETGRFETWLDYLRSRTIDLLVAGVHEKAYFTVEDEWARRAGFPLIYDNEDYHIYAISEPMKQWLGP